ncbi:ATP-dependent DNA helicase recQ [Spraguea lophii 42_110]|uniref:ATP-dependent DNA helicase n=1 Tax=Spraguea lophii (strain 42_110) TaxID=1358809 RepID=S7W9X7_SPRLO|nr:ATP-dependent DNA helicase recQ [Spraguea lophii 42_110]
MDLSDEEYINISHKHKQLNNKLNKDDLCMKNDRDGNDNQQVKSSIDCIINALSCSDGEIDTSYMLQQNNNEEKIEDKSEIEILKQSFSNIFNSESDSSKTKINDDSYGLTRRLKISNNEETQKITVNEEKNKDQDHTQFSFMKDCSTDDDVIIYKKEDNDLNLESENLFSMISDDIEILSDDISLRNIKYLNEQKEEIQDAYEISSISDDISISKIYSVKADEEKDDKTENNKQPDDYIVQNESQIFKSDVVIDDVCSKIDNPRQAITDINYTNENPLLYKYLKDYFDLDSFRVNQEDIVIDCINGKDVFVLMPTGGGKSLCFQLSALLSDGVTIIISPLLSLIEDQVRNLLEKNILALRLVGGMSREDVDVVYEAIKQGVVKILYVTPELFCRSERLGNLTNISRIVIDEAHCVSQWGFDFRPDYVQLADNLREINIPVIALTATANSRVEKDIVGFLKNPKIYRSSFNRKNIKYEVREKNKNTLINIVSFINAYYPNSRGIIYCTTKKECEEITDKLQDYKISAKYFHAGLSPKDRRNIQEDWSKNLKIIVATIAFGMGIDRKDVRFVIHYTLPKSVEGYYQESGRAGRDGLESISILYYSYADKRKIDFLIEQSYKNNRTFTDRKQKQDIKQRSKDELSAMIEYCENKVMCRRTLILEYFGEKFNSTNCTGCDNCKNKKKYIKIKIDKKITNHLISKVRQKDFTINQLVIECKKDMKNIKDKNTKKTHTDIFSSLSTFQYKTKIIIIERTIKKLLEKNILKEKIITNRIGYSNIYLAYNFKQCKEIEIVIEEEYK